MAFFKNTFVVLLACLMQGQAKPVEEVGIAQIATIDQSTSVWVGVDQTLAAVIDLQVGVYGDKQRGLQVEDWSSVGGVLSNKMSSIEDQHVASNSKLSFNQRNNLPLMFSLKDVITIDVGPTHPMSALITVDLEVYANKRQNGTFF